MFKRFLHIILFALLAPCLHAQQTQKLYLSGTGNDNTVNWEFFCTGGMNANKWTTISVPSCWELQGFGKYDYGFARDSVRGKEKGLYKYNFTVPASWKNKTIRIVFEGVMTDAEVKINGQSAGDTHQGAFYCFKYDITKLLKSGQSNLLEVAVSKHSANESVNAAERSADYWIFGGIFRPVYLEALPSIHMDDISINAKADGTFMATFTAEGRANKALVDLYDNDGKLYGTTAASDIGDQRSMFLLAHKFPSPKLWSPEFPNLYKAVFKLYSGDKLVHTVTKNIGFRTVQVKPRDGVYVNGVKVKMKGVNRHSFWPTSGRTTSKELSVEDVLMMKDMNMNAVRMSHYPPDDHFLDACDSLGLFVMDELAGWHGSYDTPIGTRLLKEMIKHDENHPSIIFWSNGNEGGHNVELDSLFKAWDSQKRPVVHPWQFFGNIETQHYREYNNGIGNWENAREIVMPTEFLHGQFDGGLGAGLSDYWEAMWKNPLSAGGFLWDFADEGVVRKDLHDSIDTDKFHGADGIVSPFHELEGSYYAIKEIWSPIYFEKNVITDGFDGKLNIENRYHFTNLKQCKFEWEIRKFDDTCFSQPICVFLTEMGTAISPDIKPLQKGVLQFSLPADWKSYDVLYVTAYDNNKREIFIWSFPISKPSRLVENVVTKNGNTAVSLQESDSLYHVTANGIDISINRNNGKLVEVKNAKGIIPFNNGPVLQDAVNNFQHFTTRFEGKNLVIESTFDKTSSYNTLQWTIYPSGWIKMKVVYFAANKFGDMAGVNFSLPENKIREVDYLGNGPWRVWKNRMKGTRFKTWNKQYNNTETGESWKYPEFKGYYSNIYGCWITTADQPFLVLTENEDLFLRLYTPAPKTDQWHNYELIFPDGDISFMNAIPAIGTKSQRNETTGPNGMKHIFYTYDRDQSRALKMVLYFDFSGKYQ